MKAQFFYFKRSNFKIGFLATFKTFVWFKQYPKKSSMWLLLHYIESSLENSFNSRMCAGHQLASFIASVQNEQPLFRKLLQSNPELVSFFLKAFATD